MKFKLTFVLLFLLTVSFAQIKVIKNDEVYLIGEVNEQWTFVPKGKTSNFVVSLSYLVTPKGNLYSLKFFQEPAYKESINFYATPAEIDDLYNLILKDFDKLPGEFETIVVLGDPEIKIQADFLSMEIAANIGKKLGVLDFTLNNKTIFTLNKEDLSILFGKS